MRSHEVLAWATERTFGCSERKRPHRTIGLTESCGLSGTNVYRHACRVSIAEGREWVPASGKQVPFMVISVLKPTMGRRAMRLFIH
jgi:hypothetical protein